MDQLPQFTKAQKDLVIECLQTTTPYKEIALIFRDYFPEYAKDMDQDLFLEKFSAKCRRYVADKRRPEYLIIKEGRAKEEGETIDHVLMTKQRYREEQRQHIYEEMEALRLRALATSDKDESSSIKNALSILKAQLSLIDTYDKRVLDREKMEKAAKAQGHGITIPKMWDDEDE